MSKKGGPAPAVSAGKVLAGVGPPDPGDGPPARLHVQVRPEDLLPDTDRHISGDAPDCPGPTKGCWCSILKRIAQPARATNVPMRWSSRRGLRPENPAVTARPQGAPTSR
eukprot:scaffold29683_cov21-Prasinocladus_malaysianus.AAC.1